MLPRVPEGVLLDAAADLMDYGRAELDHVEGVQDRDRFGQFVADRVRATAERIQSSGFDSGSKFLAALFESVGVGLPGPFWDEVQ